MEKLRSFYMSIELKKYLYQVLAYVRLIATDISPVSLHAHVATWNDQPNLQLTSTHHLELIQTR